MAFDPTSERAQTAIARTKFLHTGYRSSGKILEFDMLYTLSLFALEPIRFIAMFEWRELSDLEQCAIGTYWKSLGDALEISFAVLPSGPHGFKDGLHFLEELREWSLKYEMDYMKPTSQNKEVAEKTMDVLLYAVPKVLRPIGVNFASCVMDDRLREAMMYVSPTVLSPQRCHTNPKLIGTHNPPQSTKPSSLPSSPSAASTSATSPSHAQTFNASTSSPTNQTSTAATTSTSTRRSHTMSSRRCGTAGDPARG
jgi:hypothetical protein